MNKILNLPFFYILNFFLIFIRISGVLFFGPVFSSRVIPAFLKAGLAVLISLVIFPFIKKINFSPDQTSIYIFFSLILLELAIGMIIGFLATFVFAAIQTAGQLIGFSMGLAIANVLDPITNEQVSEISHLQNIFALWLFLIFNGHYLFIKACVDSFKFIPLGGFYLKTNFFKLLIKSGGDIFIIAVKIGAPIIIALLIVDIVFAILARLAPQINILIVGIPIKIVVGFFFLMVSIPLFIYMFNKLFTGFMGNIFQFLRSFG